MTDGSGSARTGAKRDRHRTTRLTLRLSDELRTRLDRLAEAHGLDRNRLVALWISSSWEKLERYARFEALLAQAQKKNDPAP